MTPADCEGLFAGVDVCEEVNFDAAGEVEASDRMELR